MGKITITKKTGTIDSLNLMSAFKVDNNTYVVLDSEKNGSMGLPIIYVSKLTDHLEKIVDDNEWQSVKNYLKGIINGTNFEYININENQTADESYYKELSLPSVESFNAIKTRYNPPAPAPDPTIAEPSPVTPEKEEIPTPISNIPTQETVSTPNVVPDVVPVVNEPNVNVAPTTPIMPATPVAPDPVITPSMPEPTPSPEPVSPKSPFDFSSDKETFLKACENMFDALIAKYQKELSSLEAKQRELTQKESEINAKLASASEHLANAEAKEQVANIVHDNAQKVMDLNSLMPTNPENPVN